MKSLVLAAWLLATPAADAPPDPALVTLASLAPGGGHVVLGEWDDAARIWAVEGAFLAAAIAGWNQPPIERAYRNSDFAITWLLDAHSISIYDAYRRARLLDPGRGRYPIPSANVPALMRAPFDAAVMRKPEVWIPTAAVAVLGIVELFVFENTFFDAPVSILGQSMSPGYALVAGTGINTFDYWVVAMGEEALFRGVLQTVLTESLGPVLGIGLATAMFSLAHYTGGLPQMAVAGFGGLYDGLVYFFNGHDLRSTVALHFWYDLIVSTADFLLSPNDQEFTFRIAVPF